MEKPSRIATIRLDMDDAQLERITSSGRLEDFVDKATVLFKRDLKAQLVTSSAISTDLAYIDGDFGTIGPRPPIWWNIKAVEELQTKLRTVEMRLGQELLEGEQFNRG